MTRSLSVWSLLLLAITVVVPTWGFEGEEYAFTSYGKVPTYKAMISHWGDGPRLHVFDTETYKRHGAFVSEGLGTGQRFREIASRVRHPGTREYLPLFIYDLGEGSAPYTWAVRLVDYSYRDTDAELAETVVKSVHLVAAHLDRPVSQGLVVLAPSSAVRPNTQIAPMLEAEGLNHASLSEMIAQVQADPVQVLNPGTAVGVLRRNNGGPRDIVVFDEVPSRVPPVAGIITLAPQTPLSHVNLLARNRGTMNLCATRMAQIPGLEANLGRRVRIDADDKGIRIQPISEVDAASWWQVHAPPPLAIPAPVREGPIWIDLSDNPLTDVRHIGAKASNYARLQRTLGAEVRPGYALSFSAYAQTLAGSDAPSLIEAVLAAPPAQRPARLEKLRRSIRRAPIPDEVVAAVRALLSARPTLRRIRLRSSTNSEDLPRFNGAGLYRSKGFNAVDSDEVLREKLGKVFASLWSEHAFAEREFFGIDHRQVAMAVLIHEAFPDEWGNGVVLTQATPEGLRVIVNAQRGEASVTNPEPGERPEVFSFVAGAPSMKRMSSASSIGAVFADGDAASLLPRLDALAREIHELLVEPRRREGDSAAYGVDIEFKIVEEGGELRLFVKQARLLLGGGVE